MELVGLTQEEFETAPEALERLSEVFDNAIRSVLRPDPILDGSEWANKYRMLSAQTSAHPGRYRWQVAPYQKEMIDVSCDRDVQRVVMMLAARTGKSVVLENTLGYFVHQSPSPILCLFPDLSYSEWWSKTCLDPLLYETPVLRGLFTWGGKDGSNTKFIKKFAGGSVSIVGSNSPAGLRGKTIRVVLADETDAFADSTGDEGDPLALAEVRTTTFGHRGKMILASTPGIKHFSTIEAEFEQSDKRYYNVPCPKCVEFQRLEWFVGEKQYGLRYSDDEDPTYECQKCGYLIPESKKPWMINKGKWIPTQESNTIGFHLNSLYSPFISWKQLVKEWKLTKGNKAKLHVFYNTRLAQTWDDSQDLINANQLAKRLETYNAPVPTKEEDGCNGVGVLTAGVDIQKNRIEMLVLGSGADDELYCIDTLVFEGDTAQYEVWDKLREAITYNTYALSNGTRIRIRSVCVDSGYQTDLVYRFCEKMTAENRKVIVTAVKGIQKHQQIIADLPTQSKKYSQMFRKVGTDMAKDHLIPLMANPTPGPNYLHVPIEWPHQPGSAMKDHRWVSKEFLDELTSEKATVVNKGGKKVRQWVCPPGVRNEKLDCYVYAYAAMRLLGIGFLNNLGQRAQELANAGVDNKEKTDTPIDDSDIQTERPAQSKPTKTRTSGVRIHKPLGGSDFWNQ